VRQAWGEYRVYFYDDNGDLKLLPAEWTDVDPLDPFIAQANGRAHFLPSALLALSHLLTGLQERRDADEG